MLYTGKGDNGDTSFFGGCDQRFSKSSMVAEALGALDELNTFVGLCKAHKDAQGFAVLGGDLAGILEDIQHNIFTAQAQVAGADKEVLKEKVTEVEQIIGAIEKEIPPITSFSIPGGTELSALLDVTRAVSRRAERRVVGARDEGLIKMSGDTLPYLNRLSSLLFALVRLVNHKAEVKEKAPHYR